MLEGKAPPRKIRSFDELLIKNLEHGNFGVVLHY